MASSNFDQTYTSGWISQFSTTFFDQVSDGSTVNVMPSQATSVAVMDNFAATMLMQTTATTPAAAGRLFITTRSNPGGHHCTLGNQCGGLTSVLLNPADGKILCSPAGCSLDAIDLTNFNINGVNYQMTDPFAMTFAPPGRIAVTNMSPSPSGQPGVGLDAVVAFVGVPALPATPTAPTSATAFSSIVSAVKIGTVGANSVAVKDGVVYAGGCFTRVQGETVVPCLADSSITQYKLNPLRYFFEGADQDTSVDVASLGTFLNGGITEDMVMSSDGSQIFVANTIPNALLVFDTPRPGDPPLPVLRAVIPLANEPNRMLVLPRPGQSDLVAITTSDPNVVLSTTSALLIVDPEAGIVRAQVEPLSRTPYGLTAFKAADHYRIYVTLFGACGVAAIDVPDGAPENAKHVSTVGSCP